MIKLLVTVEPTLLGNVTAMAALRAEIRTQARVARDAGFDESMFARYGIFVVKIAEPDEQLVASLRALAGVHSVAGEGVSKPTP